MSENERKLRLVSHWHMEGKRKDLFAYELQVWSQEREKWMMLRVSNRLVDIEEFCNHIGINFSVTVKTDCFDH